MFIDANTHILKHKNKIFSAFSVAVFGAGAIFTSCSSTTQENTTAEISLATPTPIVTISPQPTPTITPSANNQGTTSTETTSTLFAKIPQSMQLQKEKIILNSVDKSTLTEITNGEFENQAAMLPYYANANSEKFGIIQRRFANNSDFDIYARDNTTSDFYSLFQNNNFIFDHVSVCNLSKEVIYLSTGIDASGKPFKNKKPRRLYVFSGINGDKNLLWRMGSNERGFIGHAVSATPDCKHLLINLHLETEGTRIPSGKLIYVKNEPNRWNELPFTVLAEIKPGGQLKNFASAVFAMPQNPALYKSSPTPPSVIAIQQNTDLSVGRAFIFNPNTKGTNWKRNTIELPKSARRIFAPVFYNKLDYGFVLYDKQEQDNNGIYKTAVGLLNMQNENSSISEIIDTTPYVVSYLHVHPLGNRMALSFVLSSDANTQTPKAGVLELTFNQNNEPKISLIEELPPFRALSAEHNPRATYTAEGNYLLYNYPLITLDATADIFNISTKVNSELKFPTKLMQLPIK